MVWCDLNEKKKSYKMALVENECHFPQLADIAIKYFNFQASSASEYVISEVYVI